MSSKSRKILNIVIEHKGWSAVPRLQSQLERAAEATLAALPKKLKWPCSATVLLTGNAKIRQLNREFRGLDKPTNVLSFPQYDPHQLTKKGKKQGPVELGDIAIAYQYMVVEAKKDHKILINHVIHLLIHGILHLLGYDHISNSEAASMERLEKRIMAELGLPDPYRMSDAKHSQPRKRK